jgi:hypothetical protein
LPATQARWPRQARAPSLLGAGPWSVLAFGVSNNRAGEQQLGREEAELIVDTFMECTTSWKLLLILSVTSGAEKISDSYASCVSDRLADDDARRILVGEIDRAYEDPTQPDAQPFPDLVDPLVAAVDVIGPRTRLTSTGTDTSARSLWSGTWHGTDHAARSSP